MHALKPLFLLTGKVFGPIPQGMTQPARNGRLQALVLDFDGTLAELTIDFADMKRRLAALAAAYLGEEPAANGLPALEWLALLTEEIAGVEGRETALEFGTRGRFLIMDMELAAARRGGLFPFARPALAGLRGRGLRTAVITRNCTAAVKIVFPDILTAVDCFLAREDVPRPKPDPDHAAAALRVLGVSPAHALMVGDHTLDIATGLSAGMPAAGVATGRVPETELAAAGAVFTAPDLPALLTRLAAEGLV